MSWVLYRLAFAGLCVISGCRTTAVSTRGPAVIATDAEQYTVRVYPDAYEVTINFYFVNTSGNVLSVVGCGGPPQPVLEKHVDGQWVLAYSPAVFACLRIPHYHLPPDSSYRSSLWVAAGKPGSRLFPQFALDSIPGTYRLRWRYVVGRDPESPSASIIDFVSNEIELLVP